MIRRFFLCAVAAGAAGAQPPPHPPADTQEVVVTGKRAVPEEEARRYVTGVSRPTGGQVARFHDPVCVTVQGLGPAFAEAVRNRMLDVATAAGVATAPIGCLPNITVMIVDNARGIAAAALKGETHLFQGVSAADRAALSADPGPVYAWSVTQLRSEDGRLLTKPIDFTPQQLRVDSASIIRKPTRQDIAGAFVLIDAKAVLGRSLQQIADYAAMRTLARTRPIADGTSILSLFDPGAKAPDAMTPIDTAYIHALYHGPANRGWIEQVGAISRSVAAPGG